MDDINGPDAVLFSLSEPGTKGQDDCMKSGTGQLGMSVSLSLGRVSCMIEHGQDYLLGRRSPMFTSINLNASPPFSLRDVVLSPPY